MLFLRKKKKACGRTQINGRLNDLNLPYLVLVGLTRFSGLFSTKKRNFLRTFVCRPSPLVPSFRSLSTATYTFCGSEGCLDSGSQAFTHNSSQLWWFRLGISFVLSSRWVALFVSFGPFAILVLTASSPPPPLDRTCSSLSSLSHLFLLFSFSPSHDVRARLGYPSSMSTPLSTPSSIPLVVELDPHHPS